MPSNINQERLNELRRKRGTMCLNAWQRGERLTVDELMLVVQCLEEKVIRLEAEKAALAELAYPFREDMGR